MEAFKDLVGQKFGRLTVVQHAGPEKSHHTWWCSCECGTERRVWGSDLKSGKTRSCGCFNRERTTTHGMTASAIYSVWHAMKGRCLNKNAKEYRYYGGRGITVCARWLNFVSFFQDMGHPPDGLTLERIDNNANYSPEIFRWATRKEQARNRRDNHFLTLGSTTLCLEDWAIRQNLNLGTLRDRLQRGWPPTQALLQPAQRYGKSDGNQESLPL